MNTPSQRIPAMQACLVPPDQLPPILPPARKTAPAPAATPFENETIALALRILETRMQEHGAVCCGNPGNVRDYLRLAIASKPFEVFVVLFLDVQNRLIAAEEMFRGTLTHTSVHPREIARSALLHNAAAIICAHNHPSGETEPSKADELLTVALYRVMQMVDVALADHFIIGQHGTASMAEQGYRPFGPRSCLIPADCTPAKPRRRKKASTEPNAGIVLVPAIGTAN
jgi:hypothetical protein